MGHSLFALMARLPLDLVRVDISSLAGRDEVDRALQVLGAITHTSSSFGLTTIAGGVRTPELRAVAVAAGVQLLHGRALPHDLTADEVRGLLGDVVPA
jgi:EAL domain-containing protein (putative c-di-GMP-specific phosphodiesterase class I)